MPSPSDGTGCAPHNFTFWKLCAKNFRFWPKVARSSELICRDLVHFVGVRCRGGLRNFRPPPTGVPASIPITRSVEEYPSGHHRIPISSFYDRCLSQWGWIDFQRQLFYLPADSAETFGDFCPFPEGSKSEKNSGVETRLWGEFNGEVEILAPNFSLPNYPRAAVRDGLDAGDGPYLTS